MNRRAFISSLVATASGIVVPEPVRVYSFIGGWRGPYATGWLSFGASWMPWPLVGVREIPMPSYPPGPGVVGVFEYRDKPLRDFRM